MADDSNDLTRILLVGRTGNGKSSTGNSILGKKKFMPRSSSSIATYDIKTATIDDIPVVVVDGPGIGDTSTDATEDGQSMIALVEKTLRMTSNKFDALLVVIKYGVRFTNQEREAVQMIKAILGQDVIKNYGIIVMTHGDNFDGDVEDEETTFESWCDEQTGDIHDLFNECDKRRVLFDNRSTDNNKKREQKQQLLTLIADLKKKRQPYSEEDFRKAEPGRKKLIVKGKLPELESRTEQILDSISKRLDELSKQDQAGGTEELQECKNKLQEHKKWLEKEDEETKSIEFILQRISITENRIKTMIEIRNHKRIIEAQNRPQITKREGPLDGQEKQVITQRKESEIKADVDAKNNFLKIITLLFYVQWPVINLAIRLALTVLPGKITRSQSVVNLVKKLIGLYVSICGSVLPDSVMKDKWIVDAINKVIAQISNNPSSQKKD